MPGVANEDANASDEALMQAAHGTRHESPARTARVLLAAAVFASAYLDFFGYKAQGYGAIAAWNDRLHGVAPAPEQYRIGVLWLAHWLALHLHLALPMALASMDCISGLVAVLVLFRVLEHTALYRNADRVSQWFGAATCVLLVVWFLGWLLWLQKPETLPAAMFATCLLALWQPRAQRAHTAARAMTLVVLSLLLSTFRADLACAINLGVLWFAITKRDLLALPRGASITVSSVGALIAAGFQLLMMRVVFPHASYGRVKLWQLWPNIHHATRWPPFVLFLLPLGWMVFRLRRNARPEDAAGFAFLAGALMYGALWVTIGKIDEVRIFLPLAFALTPLTVQVAMLRVGKLRT